MINDLEMALLRKRLRDTLLRKLMKERKLSSYKAIKVVESPEVQAVIEYYIAHNKEEILDFLHKEQPSN